MKKPGGGDTRPGGNGFYSIFNQQIFRDMKNTIGQIGKAPGHESPSPLSRRPLRKPEANTHKASNSSSNTAGGGIFSKWPRKRSLPIPVPGGATAQTAKRFQKGPKQQETQDGNGGIATNQSPAVELNECSSAKSSSTTDTFTSLRRTTLTLHDMPRSDGIPMEALAVSRTFPQMSMCRDDSVFASLHVTVDEDFSYVHTAGPMEAHRHFDFTPLHDSLSPEELSFPYILKTVDNPQISNTAFRSISSEVLQVLLTRMDTDAFTRRFVLIDCRYPYEYNGGHIKNAINIHDPHHVEALFYPDDECLFGEINEKIPIFYCEFSQKRGPQMARQLRKCDRARSAERWPNVDYKEIYLLDHGYRKFFSDCKELCEPQHYVPMNCPRHTSQLKKFTQHKKRPARNLIKAQQQHRGGGGVPGSGCSSGQHWTGQSSSRPPLSPAETPVLLLFHSPFNGDDSDGGRGHKENHGPISHLDQE